MLTEASVENQKTLPEDYKQIFEIDLVKNKKQMLFVNVMAAVVMIAMMIIGAAIVPLRHLFEGNYLISLIKVLALWAGYMAYIVLHELVHGVFMKHYSGVKPKYGFTLLYAYAGSTAYFNKKSYIIIALAPVVIWGIVLGVLCAAVPADWFWIPYFIQAGNISGAAGDAYVTYKMLTFPKDILVNDTGVAMTVYSKDA